MISALKPQHEHAKIYERFGRYLQDLKQSEPDINDVDVENILNSIKDITRDPDYLRKIHMLNGKNFCHFVFFVLAKVKGKDLYKENNGTECNMEKFAPIVVFLSSILLFCFVLSVLIAGMILSLVGFAVLVPILCILISVFPKSKKNPEGDISKVVKECVNDSLFRELFSLNGRIVNSFNALTNLMPGKDLLAKMPFFQNIFTSSKKVKSKPKSEAEFILAGICAVFAAFIPLAGVVIMSLLTGTTFSFFGGFSGIFAVLGLLGALAQCVCSLYKAVSGLSNYDAVKSEQEYQQEQLEERQYQEEVDKGVETEFNKYVNRLWPSQNVTHIQDVEPLYTTDELTPDSAV
ncbi:hypothetical protein BIY23_02850 [Wolbachia pipientis]|uniref:Uncharacterized protein n=1 Tax=Wolbachia pipientis TaxID=955 RepID=A0A1E7QJH1_WOLPI|nr:hypothetical protein [Wolbachia pipientis]OEY86618.1 hypothetical protein BIY23_02850 [Wolbachia pipientis]